jgi:hypothetical protein
MAVAFDMSYNGPGATLANYDKLLQQMNPPVAHGGPHPDPDCLFHWTAGTPGGFRVVDVWTSEAEFNEFIAQIVGPLSGSIGIPQPHPDPRPIPLHNFLT